LPAVPADGAGGERAAGEVPGVRADAGGAEAGSDDERAREGHSRAYFAKATKAKGRLCHTE
jgi:hypothetical protein